MLILHIQYTDTLRFTLPQTIDVFFCIVRGSQLSWVTMRHTSSIHIVHTYQHAYIYIHAHIMYIQTFDIYIYITHMHYTYVHIANELDR